MLIGSVCQGEVVTIESNASLVEASAIMLEKNVGCLVVTARERTRLPVGMITDRDIVVRAVAKSLNAAIETVASIMSTELVRVDPDWDISMVIQMMETAKVRRVLIMGLDGRVQGIVSTDDLVRLITHDLQKVGDLAISQTGTFQSHRLHDFTKTA